MLSSSLFYEVGVNGEVVWWYGEAVRRWGGGLVGWWGGGGVVWYRGCWFGGFVDWWHLDIGIEVFGIDERVEDEVDKVLLVADRGDQAAGGVVRVNGDRTVVKPRRALLLWSQAGGKR